MKQYTEFGLKEKIPVIAGGSLVEELLLPAQGRAALKLPASPAAATAKESA